MRTLLALGPLTFFAFLATACGWVGLTRLEWWAGKKGVAWMHWLNPNWINIEKLKRDFGGDDE